MNAPPPAPPAPDAPQPLDRLVLVVFLVVVAVTAWLSVAGTQAAASALRTPREAVATARAGAAWPGLPAAGHVRTGTP